MMALAWFLGIFVCQLCQAQLSPEIGYVFPAGARSGSTAEIVLGGYDWTPDTQIFLHDPRVKLEVIGAPSDVLITEPPYWFGYKARGYAWPLPREFPARLTIPADVPTGLIRWQVANANGASPAGWIHVGGSADVVEDARRKGPQNLPDLPITVSGQIRRIEEIDRYRFSVPKSGPVTLELFSRRLNSPLHGMLKVHDPAGKLIVDVADSEGRDFAVTMSAQAGILYDVSLHDLDFAGDRSYVYRLALTAAPRVVAAYPAAGPRGQKTSVEFVGFGLATGSDQLESVTRTVAFPADPATMSIDYAVDTPWGLAKPVKLLVSDLAETVEPAGPSTIMAPCGLTGSIDARFGSDEHSIMLVKGQVWQLSAKAEAIGSPLDLELAVRGPDGKQIATSDDVAGSTDSELTLTAASDGIHRIVVTDRSGKSGTRAASYRLCVEAPREDIAIVMPGQLNIPLAGQAKLVIKANRSGGFNGPAPFTLNGLPPGVTAPENLVIPESKPDLTVDLTCAPDAAVSASLCSLTATPQIGGQAAVRTAGPCLVAITMKPRFKLTPEGLDDVRKVHRGSTYLFPLLIERLEGYTGPITLEMTAKQQRHRQGLASDEFLIPAEASRIEYPIFVPEWMETTKTSRMILNGYAQVADPKGNLRTVLQRQELRFGILPEGALMKLTHSAGDIKTSAGSEFSIPLSLSVAPELQDAIEITVVSPEKDFSAQPLALAAGQKGASLAVHVSKESVKGEHELTIRAKALQGGRWPVISETTVLVEVH